MLKCGEQPNIQISYETCNVGCLKMYQDILCDIRTAAYQSDFKLQLLFEQSRFL